jgi:hypothetical protein
MTMLLMHWRILAPTTRDMGIGSLWLTGRASLWLTPRATSKCGLIDAGFFAANMTVRFDGIAVLLLVNREPRAFQLS